jgi:hypothetical protein
LVSGPPELGVLPGVQSWTQLPVVALSLVAQQV